MNILKALFGNYSKRELKRIRPICDKILAMEATYKALSDDELVAHTQKFRDRLAKGETTDQILPEAFAVCREASSRVLGMKHFPVQIIGGIVLHQGRIAEMQTGEGKTLVATLPAYLNGLTGKGVHVVTVNDYLAKRDAELMGKLYKFLGLSVGTILSNMPKEKRKQAYNADITYVTNNELGFDYLKDNMVTNKNMKVQRGHNFAIVDEVDSILIDEARTPLIISGEGDKSTELYGVANNFVKTLRPFKIAETNAKEDTDETYKDYDYVVDEKAKTATLTPEGVEKAEKFFSIENLMDPEHATIQHHINQALKAHGVMRNEIDYVVREGQVIIVDEFTGRMMHGRRYNDGLHQAIEAKENVKVERESKTLASITFQNYFRLYNKLSGMTGTASTEEAEFREIYKLDIVEIPTNKPVIRLDRPDVVFVTARAKYKAIVDEIVKVHKTGQPVLVGTISIEKSEMLSQMLQKEGIKHSVLNAKYHEREAEIVAQAGKKGAVTIATNMAGRGTDIKLGGNAEFLAKIELKKLGFSEKAIIEADGLEETEDEEILEARLKYNDLLDDFKRQIQPDKEEVKKLGGLYIIGTERHETRRIDNQLRGRSGRQGDPGKSRFFLSAEDDLIRIFGGDRMKNIMNAFKIDEDAPIDSKMLTRSIESAQRKIEGHHYAIRKSVLQYDDVLNRQREIIYSQRDIVLNGENVQKEILAMVSDCASKNVLKYLIDDASKPHWNLEGLRDFYLGWVIREDDSKFKIESLEALTIAEITDLITNECMKIYCEKEDSFGAETMRELERIVLLQSVDKQWMEHIDAMDELKRGIGLRGYAQRDPVVDYRVEGFEMFDEMISTIRQDTVKGLLTFSLNSFFEQIGFRGIPTIAPENAIEGHARIGG